MKLSVIVLCYNFEKYIEQCLYSILSQKTDFEFEILIRDDFSTDKSSSIIKRFLAFNSEITFIEGTENIGFSRSYEQLLKLSKGEFIAYIDGDDYWLNNNKLQKQIDFLDKNPDYMMTCTGYWQKDENENYLPKSPHLWMSPRFVKENHTYTSEDFLEGNPTHYGKVYRKYPNTFFEYMHDLPMLDWPLNFELASAGKVKFMDFFSGVYRRHKGSLMTHLTQNNLGGDVSKKIQEIHSKRKNKNG